MLSEETRCVFDSLCYVLNEVLDVRMKSQSIIQASVNETEKDTVHCFWSILHSLCCPSFYNENTKCRVSNNIVNCVKLCFATFKYDSFEFYSLPCSMNYGSRELLITFLWLICETNILEIRILRYTKSLFYKELNRKSMLSKFQENIKDTADVTSTELNTKEDICNYLLWMSGRIKQNLKSIVNLTNEKSNLSSKIKTTIEEKMECVPYLSTGDILSLKYIDKTSISNEQIQHVKSVLHSYTNFKNKEELFWEFMGDVLEKEEIENNENVNTNFDDLNSFLELLKRLVRNELFTSSCDEIVNISESKFIYNTYNCEDLIKESIININNAVERLNSVQKKKFDETCMKINSLNISH